MRALYFLSLSHMGLPAPLLHWTPAEQHTPRFICVLFDYCYNFLLKMFTNMSDSSNSWRSANVFKSNRRTRQAGRKSSNPTNRRTQSSSDSVKIEVVAGSVLDAPARFAIGHCVSVCKKMGAGVAKTICMEYPENRNFRAGKVGDVGVCRTRGRTIYNMQTKPYFYNKPTFSNFEVTLRNLRRKMDQRGDKYLAIPQIGCGRDLLKWHQVLPLIKDVFRGSDIKITVYEFVG